MPIVLFLTSVAGAVTVQWLDDTSPVTAEGVTWGVAWPRGQMQPGQGLCLRTAGNPAIPMQSWPLAYWPDGSLKWTGHAARIEPDTSGTLAVEPGQSTVPEAVIHCIEDDSTIEIGTGVMRCTFAKTGSDLVESIAVGAREVARAGRLIVLREDRSDYREQGILRHVTDIGRIDSVTLEQSGPIRAVVKIEGTHESPDADRSWLPFVVRFYLYAGLGQIRITHTIVFDGQAETDFIKGLGLSFAVPFVEELQNRHVRFAGDGTGMWVQPVMLLPGYRPSAGQNVVDVYADHLAGKRTPNLSEYDERTRTNIQTVAVYNDFKLTQLGPNGFSIDKRTTDAGSWLHVTNGRRSQGLAVLGDVSGGIALGVKDFWQKYPSSFEITDAASAAGRITAWLWSPEAEAMDLRHYDTGPHGLSINYEDWKPRWSTPEGIANTSELALWAFSAIPSNEQLVSMARSVSQPPRLVCAPEHYHSAGVFGRWSLPDESTPTARWVEGQVLELFEFLKGQVDQRYWYGFWNYGDIMHHYDFARHEWRYDIGGWAWMNTELMPDMFLWYSFLRTGRADMFRMAEAMTRHTSEVDVHHIGRFALLGTRHNVSHWGDGAKQPRISHAGLKRFYYYLTADERIGDLMEEQLDADLAYDRIRAADPGHFDPGPDGPVSQNLTRRANARPGARPNRAGMRRPEQSTEQRDRFAVPRFNLDWTCYAINWMTQWERTGDAQWRDRVLAGMRSMMAGARDGRLPGGGTFDMLFGGPENMFVMESMFDYPEFWAAWANTCQAMGSTAGGGQMTGPVLTAYAADAKKDPVLGRRAWQQLVGTELDPGSSQVATPLVTEPGVVNPVHDPAFLGESVGWQLHGAGTVHWALNAIETLELAGEYLGQWEASSREGSR